MEVSNQTIERKSCDTHGEYESNLIKFGNTEFWTGCRKCDDQRLQDEAEEASRAAIAHRKQAAMHNALRRAAIPPRFADRRFETYRATCQESAKALALVQEYANDFESSLAAGRSLILTGTVGTGKTHLATSAAHAVIQKGYTAVFSSVLGAVRSVKETYGRDSDMTERQAIDALVKPDLLILDEVGVQFGSDTEKMILFEIINGRYEQVKPTIIISNLGMPELETYLGERTIDRLREGGGRAIIFNWGSHRRAAA